MTKREFIEGGLIIVGVVFVAITLIYLGQMFACLAIARMTSCPASSTAYSASLVSQIVSNLLRALVGIWLIAKNQAIAEKIGKFGVQ